MMTQQTIYDQAKQQGIEVSYGNTTSEWKAEAGNALQILCKRQNFITSEDVIVLLESAGITTGNNKALGAVMQSAQRAGLIKPTGEWQTSKLKRRHGAPVRVWKVVR
jgi:hypothetical protein